VIATEECPSRSETCLMCTPDFSHAVAALIVGTDVEDADGKEDFNIKAVLLDTAADAGAASGVAVTGAIIFVTGRWNWLDPTVALAIAVVIGYHAGGLIWRVLGALGIRPRPKRHTET
jgi:Co/Zn/Cd efflux system component